jgi:Lrp/AsnC family transcriptional regulator for asnA, asnC and gidA
VNLDSDDLMILRELQRDGRESYAELSKKTGIPTSTLHDKVKRLMASGVIEKFTIIVDDDKAGYNNIAIIGVETGARLYREVAAKLCELPEVVEVYGTTAEFDLMIKVRSRSRDDLSNILGRIRTVEGVDDIYVSSILEVFKEEHGLPI